MSRNFDISALRVIDLIAARCTRLDTGEPLGAGPATIHGSATPLTLDDVTEQRRAIAAKPGS